MLVADDSRDFPYPVVVMPDGHEFGISDIVWLVGMMEAMNSDFDRSVSLQGIDLKGILEQGALYFAADVLFDGREKRRFPNHESCLVVIELEVIGNHRAQRLEVAVVVGVEELRVEGLDGLEKCIGRVGCLRRGGQNREEEREGQQEGPSFRHRGRLLRGVTRLKIRNSQTKRSRSKGGKDAVSAACSASALTDSEHR